MAGEIAAILNSPWFDRGLAVVLVFYLLQGLHKDLTVLTSAIIKLDQNVRSTTAHQTSRMGEIRDNHKEIRSLLGGIQAILARAHTGGDHGKQGSIP